MADDDSTMISETGDPTHCRQCGGELGETDWPLLVEGNIERGCYSCYLGMDQDEVDEMVQFTDEMLTRMSTELLECRDRIQELEDQIS